MTGVFHGTGKQDGAAVPAGTRSGPFALPDFLRRGCVRDAGDDALASTAPRIARDPQSTVTHPLIPGARNAVTAQP